MPHRHGLPAAVGWHRSGGAPTNPLTAPLGPPLYIQNLTYFVLFPHCSTLGQCHAWPHGHAHWAAPVPPSLSHLPACLPKGARC